MAFIAWLENFRNMVHTLPDILQVFIGGLFCLAVVAIITIIQFLTDLW